MAQHDQVIDNGSGLTVRTDINAALAALFSSSSGPIEPGTTVAGQPWFDTSGTTGVLRVRNMANNGWNIVADFSQLGIDLTNGKRAVPESFYWNNKADGSGTDIMTLLDNGNLSVAGKITAGELSGPAVFQRNFIYGVTLANNGADAANGIDISPGSAASDDTLPIIMTLASALTKKINAAWTVGGGLGGLDTGTVSATANYHVWLIQRPDTGVVDALFSLSGTAPTMPANYTRKRRLGVLIRNGGSILAFKQNNRRFNLQALAMIRNSAAGMAATLVTFLSTSGVRVRPIISCNISVGGAAASSLGNQFGDGDSSWILTMQYFSLSGIAIANVMVVDGTFVTNTAGQLQFGVAANGTVNSNQVAVAGWYDDVWV